MPLSCLDDDGNAVDGYTIMKATDGYNYYVYNSVTKAFERSPHALNQTTVGAIMSTLGPLYDASVNSSIAMAFYNDDPPDSGSSSSYAHAKGVLATDATQGFWLVHSMPNWPNAPFGEGGSNNPGILPDDTYGQSFRCVSVTKTTVNNIADTLRVDDPKVYEGYIPDALQASMGAFQQLINKEENDNVNNTVLTFTSLQGTTYFQVAKSKEWDKDLWDDLVAPYFETPLYVETWIKGSGGRQSSICNTSTTNAHPKVQPYDVYQVEYVQMNDGVEWKNTADHSKYCVATGSDSMLTCVGDINRMCSQERRGGGALCLQDEGQHTAFTAILKSTEACYSKDPCESADCYYCANTWGPSSAPTYGSPTYAPGSPTPRPTTTSAPTNIVNPTHDGGASATAIAVGVSCGVVGLVIIVALVFYLRKRKAGSGNLRQSWIGGGDWRVRSQRNSVDGKSWLDGGGGGGSSHGSGGVRSSLDGDGPNITFGDYTPPKTDSTDGGTGVVVTSLGPKGGAGKQQGAAVVNPML
jgi:deoxyribonuclease-2